MPIRVTELNTDAKPLDVEVEVNGRKDVVKLTYSPQGYNAEMEAALREAQGDQLRTAHAVTLTIATMVTSWDVETGVNEGEMYPLAYSALAKLGTPFLAQLVNAVIADLTPGKQSGAASNAG